jgi:hypothetical protein
MKCGWGRFKEDKDYSMEQLYEMWFCDANDSDGGNIVPNNQNVVYMTKLAVTAADALLSELSNEEGQ